MANDENNHVLVIVILVVLLLNPSLSEVLVNVDVMGMATFLIIGLLY